jgi:hypothetical protein
MENFSFFVFLLNLLLNAYIFSKQTQILIFSYRHRPNKKKEKKFVDTANAFGLF